MSKGRWSLTAMAGLFGLVLVAAPFAAGPARADDPREKGPAPLPAAPPAPAPRGLKPPPAPADGAATAPTETTPTSPPPERDARDGGPAPVRYEPIRIPPPAFPDQQPPPDVPMPVWPAAPADDDASAPPPAAVVAPAPPVAREAVLERARSAFFRDGPDAARRVVEQWANTAATPPHTSETDPWLREIIATETHLASLVSASESLPPESPWVLPVTERRLRRACRGTRHEECLMAVRRFAAIVGPVKGRPATEAVVAGERVVFQTFEQVRTRVIGVLLPLSGAHAHIGQAAEKAIRLAFEGVGGIELIVRDTAGDADQAETIAREMIFGDRVAAILGPVGRLEVARVAAVTRAWGVPQVVLASQLEADLEQSHIAASPENPQEIAPEIHASASSPIGDTAVRVRTSPEELAQMVARHAVIELRLTRLAILRPTVEASERVAAAFRDEVTKLGASIVEDITFDPESKDFKASSEALVAASKAAMPKPQRRREPVALAPLFDGLFVPDNAARVRRIMPFLEYAGLRFRRRPGAVGVQLLGTSAWNQATVIDRGSALTDNAVFADTWFDGGDDDRAAAFAKRFFAAHNQKAATFHAEVFDAASVLADAVVGVSGHDHRARGEVLRRLLVAAPRAGVTGVIAFRGNEATPRGRLLTVDGEFIRERASEAEEAVIRGQVPSEKR